MNKRTERQKIRRGLAMLFDPDGYKKKQQLQHHNYYIKNREREIQRAKDWQNNNYEQYLAIKRKSWAKNKDRINKLRRKKIEANARDKNKDKEISPDAVAFPGETFEVVGPEKPDRTSKPEIILTQT